MNSIFMLLLWKYFNKNEIVGSEFHVINYEKAMNNSDAKLWEQENKNQYNRMTKNNVSKLSRDT